MLTPRCGPHPTTARSKIWRCSPSPRSIGSVVEAETVRFPAHALPLGTHGEGNRVGAVGGVPVDRAVDEVCVAAPPMCALLIGQRIAKPSSLAFGLGPFGGDVTVHLVRTSGRVPVDGSALVEPEATIPVACCGLGPKRTSEQSLAADRSVLVVDGRHPARSMTKCPRCPTASSEMPETLSRRGS